MLSKEYILLVGIGNIIAWPAAFFIMQNWLNHFACRIPLSWSIFFAAAFLSMIVALLTVSYQSIKAALMNPANSLKYE